MFTCSPAHHWREQCWPDEVGQKQIVTSSGPATILVSSTSAVCDVAHSGVVTLLQDWHFSFSTILGGLALFEL